MSELPVYRVIQNSKDLDFSKDDLYLINVDWQGLTWPIFYRGTLSEFEDKYGKISLKQEPEVMKVYPLYIMKLIKDDYEGTEEETTYSISQEV